MRRTLKRGYLTRLAAMLSGGLFFLSGCDPTISSTIENGIITLSNSFLASLFQAGLQVATEAGTTP
ncbi:MAG: hypothetical protein IID33_04525 [Planctomycetes bacterium]|nr:hypothetical protein [Planctomycetota bacterium]